MLLSKMACDGCGRRPRFMEWVRGELSNEGYPEWRHPGVVFRQAGCPITYDSRPQCAQFFFALYGRPFPEEAAFLCPDCQDHAHAELPAMVAEARAAGVWTLPQERW